MKNIAIVYRGLVRGPEDERKDGREVKDISIEWCLENIKMLKECFNNYNIKTYFFSWTYPNSLKMVSLAKYDGTILWNHPTQEELRNIVTSPYRDDNTLISTYGIFVGTKMILNLVKNSEQKFDYICISRPDLRIRINGDAWCKDCYQSPPTLLVNDMFSIAPADDMYKIWDIENSELKKICEKSNCHERMLKNRLEEKNIKYELNEDIQFYNLRNLRNILSDDKITYAQEIENKKQAN